MLTKMRSLLPALPRRLIVRNRTIILESHSRNAMLLNAMRQGATSLFAKILFSILLVAAVLGLSLGYNNNFRAGFQDDTIAKVAGQKISVTEFDHSMRGILSRNSMDVRTAYQMGYVDQILQAVIGNRLLQRATRDLGLQPGSDLVRKQVADMISPYLEKGMSREDVLKRLLASQGMSEADFGRAVSEEVANNILRGALQSGTTVMPVEEATDLARYQQEERTIQYVALPDSAIKDYKTPTDAMLMPFYQAGKERYALSESRRFSMMLLKSGSLDAAIGDTDLQKAYQENTAKFTTPETRTMEQAIFKDQAAAQAAATKARAGASLKDTAGGAYLGKEGFQKEGLDPAIAEPAFAARTGDVIGPVHTALGWHVLVVEAIAAPVAQPFATVKDQLRQDLRKSRASDALYALSTKIDNALSGGSTLEDVAKDNGLTIQKFADVRASGKDIEGQPALKDYPDDRASLIKTVFQTEEGEAAPSVELKDGSYAVIRVDGITPRSYKPFATVRDELSKLWIADQQDVLNGDKAHSALKALDAKSTTLEKIAADNHVPVRTLTFKRADPPSAPLTRDRIAEIPGSLAKGQHAGASMQ